MRRLVALIGVAVASSSCSLDVADDGINLALYVSVDKGVLGLEETVTVTLTARNVGFEPMSLTGPSDCLLYFDVYDTQQTRIYNSATQCTGSTVTRAIAAGEDFVVQLVWDGSGSGGSRVPTGLYHIQALALLTDRSTAYTSGAFVTLSVEGG